MNRVPVRLLITASLLFFALPQGAPRAEESLVWTEKSDEGRVSLAYGPLDQAKTPLFLLTCFNNMNVAVLEIFGAIEGTRPGQPLTITLSAANAKLPLKGEVSVDDATSSMFAEASDLKVKPVLEVLRASGASDQGRADTVEKFDEACKPD